MNLLSALNINGVHRTRSKTYLNTFFTNIAQNTIQSNGQINEQNILPDENPDTTTLVLQPKTRLELSKLIQSIKTKSSTGYDNISTKLLKICKKN